MKNTKGYTENEFDYQTEALLNSICRGTKVNKFYDDFGDTEWLDEFVEDFLQG